MKPLPVQMFELGLKYDWLGLVEGSALERLDRELAGMDLQGSVRRTLLEPEGKILM